MNDTELTQFYEIEMNKLQDYLSQIISISDKDTLDKIEEAIRLEQVKIRALLGIQLGISDLQNFKTYLDKNSINDIK